MQRRTRNDDIAALLVRNAHFARVIELFRHMLINVKQAHSERLNDAYDRKEFPGDALRKKTGKAAPVGPALPGLGPVGPPAPGKE